MNQDAENGSSHRLLRIGRCSAGRARGGCCFSWNDRVQIVEGCMVIGRRWTI